MRHRRHRLSCILCICLTPLAGACSPFSEELGYNVVAFNYGKHGVILKDFLVYNAVGEMRKKWRISPGIPGVWGDVKYFEQFIRHPDSLPESLNITWQLAELKNCDDILTSESMIDNTADLTVYTRKEGCDWTPIEDQVFTQQLDMEAIRNSEAYEKASNPPVASHWLGHKPKLVIVLMFREGKLEVDTQIGHTPAFMQ